MKNIIAAVDFSPVSLNAARYAVQLAGFYKARVVLYHAWQLPVTANEIGYPFVNAAEVQNLADFQMQELVTELSKIPVQPVSISSRVESASLADGLHALVAELKADRVVMGITGKSGLKKILLGSNTIYAVQHLHCPVLIIPPGAGFSNYWKIGLAVDYKNAVAPAVANIVNEITSAHQASLYIINVDWKDEHHTNEDREHQTMLRKQLATNNVHFRSLLSENVATAIHDFTENEKIDLLVTLPKKHNFFDKLFGDVHTPALLQHTHIPVLCIPE